ncbi:hypothetical protein DM01DRAFT_251582 [Hesseltinella vesiculosa]|uniref:Uncharacterized protein n=1 Tax=Hesseltinella vesiculosa TaxID=101127 RepID=A0A1X2G475_9FUNG|nr:hypothetical protein DM01DRAFT_251582 [Hesseltinella vesiculosa]
MAISAPHKALETNDHVTVLVPLRRVLGKDCLLLSDIRCIVPTATAVLSNDKMIPFEIDPATFEELTPKRMVVHDMQSVWQIHSPPIANQALEQRIDQLVYRMDLLISSNSFTTDDNHSSYTPPLPNASDQIALDENNVRNGPNVLVSIVSRNSSAPDQGALDTLPPPAFSGSGGQTPPPSYETSILSTIKTLSQKLRLFESHIPNRHKSPRWLARRQEWVDYQPISTEQVAYQLVQLEMALLWTAVTESWIQERETWLTLVASARTERHLAGALVNLERHTLTLDDAWQGLREEWLCELLEIIVSVGY